MTKPGNLITSEKISPKGKQKMQVSQNHARRFILSCLHLLLSAAMKTSSYFYYKPLTINHTERGKNDMYN